MFPIPHETVDHSISSQEYRTTYNEIYQLLYIIGTLKTLKNNERRWLSLFPLTNNSI